MSRIAAIIPARFASSRLPGKPLIKIAGVTMVERVWRQAKQANLVDEVIVATEDERIANVVQEFGGQFLMTSPDHLSGTDRLAEVASLKPEFDILVNVQGDQPMIDPKAIDAAIEPLANDKNIQMSTIAAPLADIREADNPDTVKVVRDAEGFALYFSRSPIPHFRNEAILNQLPYLGHVGLYVYRRDALLKFAKLPPSLLELAESLEQLRALENGIRIKVVVQKSCFSPEVNILQDLDKVESALKSANLST